MKTTEAINGITARDYIAIEVIQGLLASGNNHNDGLGDEKLFSTRAYKYADAMIEESNLKDCTCNDGMPKAQKTC